jgi:hypothetical protein
VWIARQDERVDAEGHVGAELGDDLVGVADDRGAAAGSRSGDAGPQVVLDEAVVVGGVAQLSLACTPADAVSSERFRIASPSAASSFDSSRVAAARASASVSRTTTCVR